MKSMASRCIRNFFSQSASRLPGANGTLHLKDMNQTLESSHIFDADHVSHEKNPLTFHYTGRLIGIIIMVYYNPHITG